MCACISGDAVDSQTDEVKNRTFRTNSHSPPWSDVIKDGLSEPGGGTSISSIRINTITIQDGLYVTRSSQLLIDMKLSRFHGVRHTDTEG